MYDNHWEKKSVLASHWSTTVCECEISFSFSCSYSLNLRPSGEDLAHENRLLGRPCSLSFGGVSCRYMVISFTYFVMKVKKIVAVSVTYEIGLLATLLCCLWRYITSHLHSPSIFCVGIPCPLRLLLPRVGGGGQGWRRGPVEGATTIVFHRFYFFFSTTLFMWLVVTWYYQVVVVIECPEE